MNNESVDPDHYKTDAGIDAIDAIRAALGQQGFIDYCRGQVLRYAWRCGRKDETAMEMGKAEVYARWAQDAAEGRKELRK